MISIKECNYYQDKMYNCPPIKQQLPLAIFGICLIILCALLGFIIWPRNYIECTIDSINEEHCYEKDGHLKLEIYMTVNKEMSAIADCGLVSNCTDPCSFHYIKNEVYQYTSCKPDLYLIHPMTHSLFVLEQSIKVFLIGILLVNISLVIATTRTSNYDENS